MLDLQISRSRILGVSNKNSLLSFTARTCGARNRAKSVSIVGTDILIFTFRWQRVQFNAASVRNCNSVHSFLSQVRWWNDELEGMHRFSMVVGQCFHFNCTLVNLTISARSLVRLRPSGLLSHITERASSSSSLFRLQPLSQIMSHSGPDAGYIPHCAVPILSKRQIRSQVNRRHQRDGRRQEIFAVGYKQNNEQAISWKVNCILMHLCLNFLSRNDGGEGWVQICKCA